MLQPECLLQARELSKSHGPKTLFDLAEFSIHQGDHIGVIGINGCGKSTLFQILTDEQHSDNGVITRKRGLRTAHLKQIDDWIDTETAEEYLLRQSGPFAAAEMWEYETAADQLDIPLEYFKRPLASLSGGYRMRFKLLKQSVPQPDILLLDEPTNYLDLDTILILEDFLAEYQGTFLLISHDKEFLRKTVDQILEIDAGKVTQYPGGLDDFFDQKALWEEERRRIQKNQSNERQALLDFVNRFKAKASKAKQAQSRMKRLEKMPVLSDSKNSQVMKVQIPNPEWSPTRMGQVKDGVIGYTAPLVKDIQLSIQRSSKIAIVGANGLGKSTLLKTLAGKINSLGGEWNRPEQFAFFHQHLKESLNEDSTVLEELEKACHKSLTRQNILDLAGGLLFSGNDVNKPIRVLSGGEKTRVALGQILLSRAPLLLLDEPTNHLDFYSVEALAEALKKYAGSIIVVSHDRSFIATFAQEIIEVNNGLATHYPGSYSEYAWSREFGVLSAKLQATEQSTPIKAIQNSDPISNPSTKSNFKQARKQFKDLKTKERNEFNRCESLEKEIADLNHSLTLPKADIQNMLKVISDKQQELEQSEHLLLVIIEELEILKSHNPELQNES